MHTAINHKTSDDGLKRKYDHRKSGVRPTSNGYAGSTFGVKRFRDTDMVIIRNKYTKEVVDLEVKSIFTSLTL